jgi:hypothetical protein
MVGAEGGGGGKLQKFGAQAANSTLLDNTLDVTSQLSYYSLIPVFVYLVVWKITHMD